MMLRFKCWDLARAPHARVVGTYTAFKELLSFCGDKQTAAAGPKMSEESRNTRSEVTGPVMLAAVSAMPMVVDLPI